MALLSLVQPSHFSMQLTSHSLYHSSLVEV